ncbi:hypothetical protein BCR15_10620 [Tessaracoccus lapidicaptus]|uniref:Uracil-DNA glycosylase-like domain-containing protein n=1 Tax=Tessaracoccus lapidicaptus TaxID=1427523 RepID=A0A1C0AGT8_9ACTN|nr:mismatch-specific DNA-glycosylase [Tessaracoccus lapidicaptus]OCL30909.1 hypothetical protein BCR15_10620 [Tessaracoccus lapidicaptus]
MLPDLLRPDLDVVFCGTAVSSASADLGHYYAGRGNKFWQLLFDAGFTPSLLTPAEDATVLDYGIGITDLVKDRAQSHDRGLDFGYSTAVARELISQAPRWVAFNGLTAGRSAGRELRLSSGKTVRLGEQPWRIGTSRVFVLPSSSGAFAAMRYAEKLEWWTQLRRDVY